MLNKKVTLLKTAWLCKITAIALSVTPTKVISHSQPSHLKDANLPYQSDIPTYYQIITTDNIQQNTPPLALAYSPHTEKKTSQTIVQEKPKFTALSYRKLPFWDCGDQFYAYKALMSSCEQIIKNGKEYSNTWKNTCRLVLADPAHTHNKAKKLFEKYFTPYLVSTGNEKTGLFTGYYAPAIKGSRTRSKHYSVPIYATPSDLVTKKTNNKMQYGKILNGKLEPYLTRAEINQYDFLPNTEVIAWLASKVERTFLQIQGSGRIEFNAKDSILVGYDSQNGQPYYPIGRYLLEKKYMPRDKISMQSIKAWLNANPDETNTVLNYDPSFVFFKVLTDPNPIGAQGVPLTPGYSLAIDKNYYQYGTPVWLCTTYQTQNNKTQPLNRLFIAQDTGGAIKGPIRGDVFWGAGKLAEFYAGHMKQKGSMFILLPKGMNPNKNKK